MSIPTNGETKNTDRQNAELRRWEMDYPGEKTPTGARAWRQAMITEAIHRAALPYELMALEVIARLKGLTVQDRMNLLDGLLGIKHASAAVAAEFADALQTVSATPETAALEDREAKLREIAARCNLGNDGRQVQDRALAARLERKCRALLDQLQPQPGDTHDAA